MAGSNGTAKLLKKAQSAIARQAEHDNAPKKAGRFGGPKSVLTIKIPQIEIKTIKVHIVGDAPLVVHAWTEKAMKMILQKQMMEAMPAKEAKDPWMDYVDSMHWLTPKPDSPTAKDIAKARFGFPIIAFKAAAVSACSFVDGITKVLARGAFHLNGPFVEIKCDGGPVMRTDMVRLPNGNADIRHRGEFTNWSADLMIRYSTKTISAEQIINLFNHAGFHIGIGEHRIERDGVWGTFHVE